MASVMIVEDRADDCRAARPVAGARRARRPPRRQRARGLAPVINGPPDVVVVLDLVMPEMVGPTFLEVIRSYLRRQVLSVVVSTGIPDSPMVDRVRHLKVNDVLVKGKATHEHVRAAVEAAVVRAPG
jgi:CheY-like chemotaxis protein